MPSVPTSMGLIMDGNRRYAKERGMPTLEGHRKGAEKVLEVVEWAKEAGVRELIFYTFSTENWNRSPEEVDYLMSLVKKFFSESSGRLEEAGVRVRVLGSRERVPEDVRHAIEAVEERTRQGALLTASFAFSYGGRTEILDAVNELLKEGVPTVTEEIFANTLYTKGLADPDLIVRTGGEMRLSNFLPWQSVYSELFFTETKWPELSKEEFRRILGSYAARERRRGK